MSRKFKINIFIIIVVITVLGKISQLQVKAEIAAHKIDLTYVLQIQTNLTTVASSTVKANSNYSEVVLNILSPDQKPVEAFINLSQIVNNKAIEICSVQTSNLKTSLTKGDYRLIVDEAGYQKTFLFSVNNTNFTKDFIFETIMIPSLTFKTDLDSKTNEVNAFNLSFVIDNLINMKKDVKIELSVYDNETLVDSVDLAYFPSLPIGKIDSTYHYVPKTPLSSNIVFKVDATDLSGIVLGTMVSQSLGLEDTNWTNIIKILGLVTVIIGLFSSLIFGLKQIKKRQRVSGKYILLPKLNLVKSINPFVFILKSIQFFEKFSILFFEKFNVQKLKNVEKLENGGQPALVVPDFNTVIKSLSTISSVTSLEDNGIFANGLKLIGDVETKSNLIIKGTVIGNIYSSECVFIEFGAVIEGNVTAKDIEISGSVKGIITAQQLSILHSAKISGFIQSTFLSVEKGASLDCIVTVD